MWLGGTRGCRSRNCRIHTLAALHTGVSALIRVESVVVVGTAASDDVEGSRDKSSPQPSASEEKGSDTNG
jgi:hypothetical protein